MNLKFILNGRYPFLHRFDSSLPSQVEELREENENLRTRLVDAQESKLTALKHAEQLRKEKERLRAKVAALKRDLGESEVRSRHLVARLEELQELADSLIERLDKC